MPQKHYCIIAQSAAAEEWTCIDSCVQFSEAGCDFSIHLPLPLWLLWKGISVGPKSLADLHCLSISDSDSNQYNSLNQQCSE